MIAIWNADLDHTPLTLEEKREVIREHKIVSSLATKVGWQNLYRAQESFELSRKFEYAQGIDDMKQVVHVARAIFKHAKDQGYEWYSLRQVTKFSVGLLG